MRINISEDEDFQNQAFLWEANQERSLKGRKGQTALRELEAALLALPSKCLIADDTITEDGQVCALAALAKHKGYEGDLTLPIPSEEYWDEYERVSDVQRAMLRIATDLKVPHMVALAIIYENDDSYARTPEQRYERVLAWTQRQLR